MSPWDIAEAFVVLDAQDSGCLSWGVEHEGQRWFVKTAREPRAQAGLARVAALHAVVRHEVVVDQSLSSTARTAAPWSIRGVRVRC